MALITCIECGKQFSNKAPAYPACGCPTSECIAMQESNENISSVLSEPVSVEESTEVSASTYFSATKKIGPVQIDEKNCRLRIKGAISPNGKKTRLVGGTFKGLMAFSTLGMSVAAEKALGLGKQKVGSKDQFEFEDLINYDLIEDDSLVTSGGVGQALISGAVFGGLGAIAGGITAKRTQKRKVESLYIKITINSFSNPCVMIPLITKPTKTNTMPAGKKIELPAYETPSFCYQIGAVTKNYNTAVATSQLCATTISQTYPGSQWGDQYQLPDTKGRELVPMVTYSEMIQFVIMLCAVITLVIYIQRKKQRPILPRILYKGDNLYENRKTSFRLLPRTENV